MAGHQSFLVGGMIVVSLLSLWVQHSQWRLVRMARAARRVAGDMPTRRENLADAVVPVCFFAILCLGLFGYFLIGPIWVVLLNGGMVLYSGKIAAQYGSMWKGFLLEMESRHGEDDGPPRSSIEGKPST